MSLLMFIFWIYPPLIQMVAGVFYMRLRVAFMDYCIQRSWKGSNKSLLRQAQNSLELLFIDGAYTGDSFNKNGPTIVLAVDEVAVYAT